MRTTTFVGVLLLALTALPGCSKQDPRIAYEQRMDDERTRGPAQSEQLRERMSGQARR